MSDEDRLRDLIRGCPWLMDALRAGRAVAAPDWVIGAGALRDLVFEHLHGRLAPPPRDVDYAFFDPDDLSADRERAVEKELLRLCPALPFEASNQARVHLWYGQDFDAPFEPYRSIEHAVSTWPETATAVACRLAADDAIEIIAPCGLADLLAGVLRRNKAQVTEEIFHERLKRRDVAALWPRVRVVFD